MKRFWIVLLLPAALCACAALQPKDADKMEEAASIRSALAGRPAPPFTLADESEKPRALADYKGQWLVLYFYPQDDTPGCVCQATQFTSLLERYNDMKAAVVGVSSDTPDMHRFFRSKYGLKFTLLSDPKKEVMRLYGAWVDTPDVAAGSGRVIRSTFLISPDGVIVYHWPEVIPQGHAERVREKLADFQRPPEPQPHPSTGENTQAETKKL